MKKLKIAFSLLLILLVAAYMDSVVHNIRQRSLLDQRLADVKALTQAYEESPNAKNISDLIAVLRHENVKLNNPIPQDSSKPCYLLMSPDAGLGGTNRPNENSLILIEETNVTDSRLIVMSLRDGSVMARSRTDTAIREN